MFQKGGKSEQNKQKKQSFRAKNGPKYPVLEQAMGKKWAKYEIFKQRMIKVSGQGKKMLPGA